MRETLNKPTGDWIGDDWKYDRHGPRRLRQCPYRGRARRENDVRRESACLRISAGLVVAQWMSIRMLPPSTQPSSCNACLKAAIQG